MPRDALRAISAACLFFAALSSSVGVGQQTLKRRGAVLTPQLQAIYASPEYARAYQNAAETYARSATDHPHTPVPWNSKKPRLWLLTVEKELMVYSDNFKRFKHRLDLASEDPEVTANPERVAQISQIQNQPTVDNLSALNTMVTAVDLTSFLTSNGKAEVAKLWIPMELPKEDRALDESKMAEVPRFIEEVNDCLTESERDRVRFRYSASFTWNVPRDEDETPLNLEQASFFWQWDNHPSLDKAVVALYDAMHKAQATATSEGLLKDQ